MSFGRFNAPDPSLPTFDVKVHINKGSKFITPHHFHVAQTEYVYVIQGTARVIIDGERHLFRPSNGQIEILPWTPHILESLGEEETVFLERTEPSDGTKEGFFRNMFGVIGDEGGRPSILQIVKVFVDWDTYPIGGPMYLAKSLRMPIVGVTHVLGWLAGVLGHRSLFKVKQSSVPGRLLSDLRVAFDRAQEYTQAELYNRLTA